MRKMSLPVGYYKLEISRRSAGVKGFECTIFEYDGGDRLSIKWIEPREPNPMIEHLKRLGYWEKEENDSDNKT